MRPVLYVLSFLALIALGFWAYRENYATQGALKEVVGVPVMLGANGIEKIIEYSLDAEEKAAFEKSAVSVKDTHDALRKLVTF